VQVLERIKEYISKNEVESALNLIMESEKEYLYNSDYWNLRAVLCLKAEEYKAAISCLMESLNIDPRNRDAYYNCAYAYENLGDLFEAAKYYGMAYKYSDEVDIKDQLNELYKGNKAFKGIFEAIANGEIHDNTKINTQKFNNDEINNRQLLLEREFKNRLARINQARKQNLHIHQRKCEEKLHIVYVMTHVGICGGVKIIFEHANRLKNLGMEVTIVSHYPAPTWFPINVNYNEVPFEVELATGIPACDVIVATYWNHIQACIDTEIAPVIYFEQGDFHLFDYENLKDALKDFIYKQYQLPKFIFTVSNPCANFICKIYNRESVVIHNAIDLNIFNNVKESSSRFETPYILMLGNPQLSFKGIDEIIEAYSVVKSKIPDIKIYLISPVKPAGKIIDRVDQVYVNPPQQQISDLYKGALLYVSASHYESFSLPVLEAMACGCPVITTGNNGVMEYAVDNENALITKIGDPHDIALKMLELLRNSDLRKKLINKGLATAGIFNWDNITNQLLEFYREVASYEIKN
jgi:L-malate glycosyltransferase